MKTKQKKLNSLYLYMHIYILLVIVGRNWPPENERGGLVTLHYWSLFSIYAFYFNLYWSIYGLPLGLWLVYKPTFQAAHLQFTGCDFSFPIFHNKKQIHFSHTHTHTHNHTNESAYKLRIVISTLSAGNSCHFIALTF